MKKNVADTSIEAYHDPAIQQQRQKHIRWYAERAIEMNAPFCIGSFMVLYGDNRDKAKDTEKVKNDLLKLNKPQGIQDSKVSARMNDLINHNIVIGNVTYEVVHSHKAPSPISGRMVNWYSIREKHVPDAPSNPMPTLF